MRFEAPGGQGLRIPTSHSRKWIREVAGWSYGKQRFVLDGPWHKRQVYDAFSLFAHAMMMMMMKRRLFVFQAPSQWFIGCSICHFVSSGMASIISGEIPTIQFNSKKIQNTFISHGWYLESCHYRNPDNRRYKCQYVDTRPLIVAAWIARLGSFKHCSDQWKEIPRGRRLSRQ